MFFSRCLALRPDQGLDYDGGADASCGAHPLDGFAAFSITHDDG
jgi:hypothetical protein